jgi:hypothetical protein
MRFLLIPILCTGLLFGNISYVFAQNETVIIPMPGIGSPITLTFDSPLKQFKSGIPIEEIKCNEDLVILIKASNRNPACVNPSSVGKLVAYGWGIPVNLLEVKNADIWIHYEFNNGEILSVKAFGTPNEGPGMIPSVSLIISLNAFQDSNLNINLPRGLIDPKIGEAADNVFVVVDGQELEVTQTITTTNRILTIPIHQGKHQLEIIGYGYYKEGLPFPSDQKIIP